MNPISPIRIPSIPAVSDISRPAGAGFAGTLKDAVGQVESQQRGAQQSALRFLSGERDDIHAVALDQQKASLTFDLFLQVRNKFVQAYQEVMRMPL
jgi:flagellar hook-basal body complex protein FliE